MKKKVLFITHDYPPPIAGGSIRVHKFAKYLSATGWEVFVACKGNRHDVRKDMTDTIEPSAARVRVFRIPTLLQSCGRHNRTGGSLSTADGLVARNARLPPSVRVLHAVGRRIRTLLGSWLVPDSYRWTWLPFVTRHVSGIINAHHIRFVVISSPPHSVQLLLFRLRREFGSRVKIIADFRDLWSLSPTFSMGTKHRRRANARIERRVIESADAVIFVSRTMRDVMLNAHGLRNCETQIAKSVVITNGFDEADFEHLEPSPVRDCLLARFHYVGTISGPRTRNALPEAISSVTKDASTESMRFTFFGTVDDQYRTRFNGATAVEFRDPVSHSTALMRMMEADVLVLILTNDLEGRLAFTGKFFEYLRAGRPILALVPKGEVSDFISAHSLGMVANPDDAIDIADKIRRLTDWIMSGPGAFVQPTKTIQKFDRRVLAKRLSDLLLETETKS